MVVDGLGYGIYGGVLTTTPLIHPVIVAVCCAVDKPATHQQLCRLSVMHLPRVTEALVGLHSCVHSCLFSM